MANHLIIGLGGTGGKIIQSLRKQIYRQTGEVEVTGDLNISYLYIDSNPEYMDLTDPSWKVMGKSVQLGTNSHLLINDCDIHQILENPSNYPGISNFLGDKKSWENVLQGVVDPTVGGQRRRLGRTLFASSVNKFNTIVENKVKELENKGNADVTFHIIFGMAGGTGSGSIIDVISQIRSRYRKTGSKDYRILTYGLMPEESAASRDSTGSYHANGYAALKELSALSTGSFLPVDVSGKTDYIKLTDNEFIFNICYVFLNENERGKVVDVDEGVINTISDFLYQKLISVKDLGSKWADLLKYENAENGVNTPESDDGKFTRSKRFMAFGIKRVTFPEEEIIEYTANSFSKQALLQLKYNNWEELEGFVNKSINHNYREEVRATDNLQRWKLSDNHLKLSFPILPEHESKNRKWRTLEDDWKFIVPKLKDLAQEKSAKTDDWLNNFEQLCHKRYDEEFRGKGVKEFYEIQANTKKEISREIRQGIEKEFFESWLEGSVSLSDLQEKMRILIEFLEERKTKLDDQLSKSQYKIEQIDRDIQDSKREFNKIGILSKAVFGKHRKLVNNHALTLENSFI
ncbi:MAG: tubulin-like doman-containing protein, partial [Cyclobacteriaceae bacterium]